jgi:GNAT superfamily N-acetyltransferase
VKDTWVFRDYQIGDEHQILTLYKEVNDRDMALRYWRWRFTKSPFGKGIIKLLFVGEKLIGHYAVTPMDVQVDGRPAKAIFSLLTMTHPSFQKQGIFTSLAEQVYAKCQSEGFGFVYGFPNENSYHGFTTKLGWIGFGRMRSLETNIDAKAKAASTPENTYEIEGFDDRVNTLWDKVKDAYRVVVPRTKDYLNWRFAEHPAVKYPKYIVTDGGSEIRGYIILKTYTKVDEAKGHIIDMLCVDDRNVVRSLLHSAYDYFGRKRIENLSCWMPDSCFCTPVLREEGFVTKEFEAWSGARIFNKEEKWLRPIAQFDSWHLTMGDSDIF